MLLTLLGTIYYIYYKYIIVFHAINIVMDSTILTQFNSLETEVNSEVSKTRKSRKKKTLLIINEVEENDMIEKRDRLITCVLIW